MMKPRLKLLKRPHHHGGSQHGSQDQNQDQDDLEQHQPVAHRIGQAHHGLRGCRHDQNSLNVFVLGKAVNGNRLGKIMLVAVIAAHRLPLKRSG